MRAVVPAGVGAMAKDRTPNHTPNRTPNRTPHRTLHRTRYSTLNRGSIQETNIHHRAEDTGADTATDMDTVKNITKVEKREKVKKSVMKRRKRSIRTRSKINVSHHHNQDHLSSSIIIVD